MLAAQLQDLCQTFHARQQPFLHAPSAVETHAREALGLQGSLQLVDFLTSKSYSVSISQSARSRVARKKYWKRLLSKLSNNER